MVRQFLKKMPPLVWLYSLYRSLLRRSEFRREFDNFKAKSFKTKNRFNLQRNDCYPCLNDKTAATNFDRHYVFHTAWAARVIVNITPEFHVDISSSLYFSSIVSAFVPVKFYDYRPAELHLSNLSSEAVDLHTLPFENRSIKSLSCMHVIEHVGLGRYGDPIDPDGDLKAMDELKRVLAIGGNLLFVVPVGKPKIMFNAHRIYSYEQIIGYFADFSLCEFALIPDNAKDGGLISNATQKMADAQSYGCGCFWFVRMSE